MNTEEALILEKYSNKDRGAYLNMLKDDKCLKIFR